MKNPTNSNDLPSTNNLQSIIHPPLEYLEGMKRIDAKLLDAFMEQSRINLELIHKREDKNLELKHEIELERLSIESEKSKLVHKVEMQPHINRKLELLGGFFTIAFTFAFLAYLITINRTDIASIFVIFFAVAAVLSAFIKKDKKP